MRRRLLPVSAVLVGAALALVGNLATSTVQVTAGWVPLVWIATGVFVVLAVVLQLGTADPEGAETAEAATRALREAVEVQWRSEVKILRLADPQPMPVRWNLIPEVALGGRIGQVELGGPVSWSGPGEDIADHFRGLATRRLVIVGGAGAGKTTLAIQLVRRLAATRQDNEPVPVFLSVSDWDLEAHPTFESWLAAQLAATYQTLREPAPYSARRLYSLGLVLPVLDGFDELSDEVRPRCLRLVNEALDERTPLVLTSRTREYAEAAGVGQLITGAAVVAAEPLSPDAAADYLDAMLRRSLPHPGWRRLLDDLRANRASPLAEVVSSPLGLWLLLTAYDSGADPSGLLKVRDTARLRTHLFDRLIPELVRVRTPATRDDAQRLRPRKAHDPADVERWLGQLAEVMRESPGERRPGRLSTGSRDFAWWRLAGMTLPFSVPALLLAPALIGIGWFMLVGSAAFRLDVVDSAVLAVAVLFLLREGKYTGPWTDHVPAPAVHGLSRRLWALPGLVVRSLPFGLFSGALFVVLYTGIGAFFTDLATAARFGLGIGALVASMVIVGRLYDRLAGWLTSATGTTEAGTPYANWRADRATQLVRLLLGAFLAGATGAVLIAAAGGDGCLTVLGAASGLIAGAGYALVTGEHNAWPAYLAATARLARGNRMPRRLMSFLDDAHRLGLLRAVGPIYQFRHADFQDHLAARLAPPPPAPVTPRPIPRHSHRHSHSEFSPTFVREFRVPRRLLDVAFSPDGQTVALFRDGATDLVDLTGRRLRRVRHGLALLRMLCPSGAVAFSPDGRHCAVSCYTLRLWPPGHISGHVTVFDVDTGREVLRIPHQAMWIQTLAYSPDGSRITTGDGDNNFVRTWDADTGEQLMAINHAGDIGSVAFSPDGRRLATGTYIRSGDGDDHTTEVWDTSTGQAVLRLRIHPTRFHNITGVAFSPGGAFVAAVNGWATTVWDAVTGTQVLTVPTGGQHVAFSPDGLHLLTSGSIHHTELRKVSDGTSVLKLPTQATRALFSPDGRLLLSVGQDRTAQLWRLWS